MILRSLDKQIVVAHTGKDNTFGMRHKELAVTVACCGFQARGFGVRLFQSRHQPLTETWALPCSPRGTTCERASH